MDENLITDGPIYSFAGGWAILPMVGRGEVAHYWKEDKSSDIPEIRHGSRVRYYRSVCGKDGFSNMRVPALSPGNFPQCKKCRRFIK